MKELDKWSAEVCEIYTWQIGDMLMFELPKTQQAIVWTLSDARCMEIFRERFSISTLADYENAWAAGTQEGMVSGKGKTIKEAELDCAKAIMETSK